ncbi:MAG TPA: transglycosylase family protein [Actinomycetota bacterium]|nr:transglycosylase family protein [Actinomycetota bacterium]
MSIHRGDPTAPAAHDEPTRLHRKEAQNMDHLHFGARSRRKARRRQLLVTAWLAGMVAAFFGVPGSNAAFEIFHLVGQSPGLAAGSIPSRHVSNGAEDLGRRLSELHTRPHSVLHTAGERNDTGAKEKLHKAHKPQPRPSVKPGPAPVSTPTPVPAAPAGSIAGVVYSAAADAGISGSYLLSVAQCESNLDPGAYGAGGYYGLFQFDQPTWSAYGYGSIYDPVAQARTAARLIAEGETSRWPNCA